LTNSAFRQNVGTNWRTALDDVLKAAKNSPCTACPPASGTTLAFPSMEKHLENVEYFVANFQVNAITSTDKFFFWMRGKKKGGGLLADNSPLKSEMAQTFHELKRRGLKEADVNQFGANYTTMPVNGTSRQSDILLSIGTHIELKNTPYNANSTPKVQAIDQVIGQNGAFGNISSLSEFEWVAFANRDNDATSLKTMWKNVFVTKADDMFKSVEDGGLGIIKIKQLFGNDVDDVSDFLDLIEDVSSNPIYDFIKAE